METQDRYTILDEIASGSTATVYLAEDKVLRRKVALKKLHPHLWNHAETVRRFEKEGVAVASLSHPNIIKVYDFGMQDKGLFLAMEYVDGSSLDRLMQNAPIGLPNLTALSVFHQLLQGLVAAHAAGIYHRDIKPSNILVDSRGCVRIADFGIAFLSEETSLTKTGSYLGTPGYSAPEQAQGLPSTDKTDIFATGILCYRCLTGRLPFEAETPHAVLIAIMEKQVAKANLVNRRIVPGLSELVDSMLEKAPSQRPSAKECLERLENLASLNGYPLDASRICRFSKNPQVYVQSEYQELSQVFAGQAHRAQIEGRQRDAMRYFSLTEIFSEPDSEEGRVAAHWIAKQATRLLWQKKIRVTFMFLALISMGWILFKTLTSRPLVAMVPQEPAQEHTQEKMVALKKDSVFREPLIPDPIVETRIKTMTQPIQAEEKPKRLSDAAANNPDLNRAPTLSLESPGLGFLLVKSNPPFAHVTVDGKGVGNTPFKVPLEMQSGIHVVGLQRKGCQPLESKFQISPAETTSLRFTLERAEQLEP